MDKTAIIPILLAGLVLSASACVIMQNLLKASIMMAAVSGVLAVVMFALDAPLAAVFELSVCAGLITVVFISAVSMTRVYSKEEAARREKARALVPSPPVFLPLRRAPAFPPACRL